MRQAATIEGSGYGNATFQNPLVWTSFILGFECFGDLQGLYNFDCSVHLITACLLDGLLDRGGARI